MALSKILTFHIEKAIDALFGIAVEKIELQATRKEFEGDITMVIFPLLKVVKSNPVELGNKIGQYLVDNTDEVVRFNVVSGFLNIVISDEFYISFFNEIREDEQFAFGKPVEGGKAVMVEYASPNTNKPLHLGHVRNVLLGYAVANIVEASGKKVYKTQVINDRGIHICKSMIAYQKFGHNETPDSAGLKGDKLVGNYYVEFDKTYKVEISQLMSEGMTEEEAKKKAPILLEAQEMLLKWEANDAAVKDLWSTMNGWVYKGFDETYKNIGVSFDKNYYESNTYLLGKDVVADGLAKGIFEKDPDGSVWIDLTSDGLDRKIVLRSDGTSVYMTQDIGTAIQRVKDFPDVGGMVYTVGNEQDYHFKVLFLILKKLGFDWAQNLYHLSYGMVDLPSGKMKSREGTVVDADDLMAEMTATAKSISEELGKLEGYSDEEKSALYEMIGLGALKYQMLRVDPKKRILFDPNESIDFNGDSGPFIQMSYVRTRAILRKADFDITKTVANVAMNAKEKELIKQLELYITIVQNAANQYSPAVIANYAYDLAKEFSSYYQSVYILGEEDLNTKVFRVQLSKKVGETIKSAFGLLGINMPERM
ncbi:arginine--tRNA ligase [Flavobacterium cerinum]|uniref:Arginine--tRNA ligase n=1 Tax=Flavobacterium cerinum TaxID=2502784 RepID=A0A3S3U276_9FLAO|nr:arginine--tRNA ligase [Flavobacterium cerinum]RWX02451.1 arginine--tRNA ligase [Flavobacterium cerinum]